MNMIYPKYTHRVLWRKYRDLVRLSCSLQKPSAQTTIIARQHLWGAAVLRACPALSLLLICGLALASALRPLAIVVRGPAFRPSALSWRDLTRLRGGSAHCSSSSMADSIAPSGCRLIDTCVNLRFICPFRCLLLRPIAHFGML